MKIIEPSVKYLKQEESPEFNGMIHSEHIARCAAICYNSQPKTGDDAFAFCKALIKRGHMSVFRHSTQYFIVPKSHIDNICAMMYGEGAYFEWDETYYYIVTNGQFIYDNINVQADLESYQVTDETFKKVRPNMMRYTFLFTTQIATGREVLLRTSPQNVTEMSTRYVKMNDDECAIVRPWFLTDDDVDAYVNNCSDYSTYDTDYLHLCEKAFNNYDVLIHHKFKPEDARGILPLDTMTKIIGTYTIKEYEHMLHLRMLDKTGKAHPNAKILATLLYKELLKLGYELNEKDQLVYVE